MDSVRKMRSCSRKIEREIEIDREREREDITDLLQYVTLYEVRGGKVPAATNKRVSLLPN